MARLARYYSLYVIDRAIIKFLESFRDEQSYRSRFIIDLFRVANRFQEEMKALGTVEPQPLRRSQAS